MRELGKNNILYHPRVIKRDIPTLDSVYSKKIKKAIEEKLTTNPETYGLPLRATLKQYWKLRVGDFRVIYMISAGTVYIAVIGHRKEVYKIAEDRI